VSAPLLEVASLNVTFATPDGPVSAVRDLTFGLAPGETLGIVGESGSGKSQAVLALMGLLAPNGRATGNTRFDERELLGLSEADLNRIRGARIAMIFQDPMTSLNPYLTIGEQMSLVLRRHRQLGRREALRECQAMLEAVHIPEAGQRLDMYPHELSGGMRQRVMIANALGCSPQLLIADEPTTALDVTIQAQILDLMKELRERFGTAIILITHDLSVVAGLADRVLVMRGGECVEQGQVEDIFYAPRTDYTQRLLAAVGRLDRRASTQTPAAATASAPLLQAQAMQVHFPMAGPGFLGGRRALRAIEDVSFEVGAGEILGVVGESGCGKTTLGRALLQLVRLTAGRVTFLGRSLATLTRRELTSLRRDLQVVFQDPLASLNPRMVVRDIVAEPLEVFEPGLTTAERTARVTAMLKRVGLDPAEMNRYPHQFSGGQCQRIAIARALITAPRLVVCDEAVSALDVSVRAQILALLLDLQRELGLALIFIGHDLAVVRQVSQRVMVMYLGRVMEMAPATELFENPRHPYTRALIAAVPIPDPRIERSRRHGAPPGDPPSPLSPPSGCVFRARCAYAVERCTRELPLPAVHGAALVACHRAAEI
jgi:oligopeptide/dipeptide ABC transporter ATP-binding protein